MEIISLYDDADGTPAELDIVLCWCSTVRIDVLYSIRPDAVENEKQKLHQPNPDVES